MADTVDDLSAPLGQETARKPRRRIRLPFNATQALAVLFGLFLAGFLGFALFSDNPLGGEPVSRVAIRNSAPAEKLATAPPAAGAPVGTSAPELAQQADPAGEGTASLSD